MVVYTAEQLMQTRAQRGFNNASAALGDLLHVDVMAACERLQLPVNAWVKPVNKARGAGKHNDFRYDLVWNVVVGLVTVLTVLVSTPAARLTGVLSGVTRPRAFLVTAISRKGNGRKGPPSVGVLSR